jgi:ABC-2 type transport system permease protein
MTIGRNLGGLAELVRYAIRYQFLYRFNLFMGIVLVGVQVYLLTVVWKAAYGGRSDVDGIALGQLLTYLTLANLQVFFLRQEIDGGIEARIRQGQIGFDLSRPVAYPMQLFASGLGDMIGKLPLLVVAFPVAFIAGELRGPTSAEAGFGYAIALLLAWVVSMLLNVLIGLIAFWTLEMNGFKMVYRLVGNFATGALIPLWFMPDALRSVIELLPFQAIAFVPVSIYVGEPATGSMWSALGLQALWVVVLALVIRWVWSQAFRHAVIQGG